MGRAHPKAEGGRTNFGPAEGILYAARMRLSSFSFALRPSHSHTAIPPMSTSTTEALLQLLRDRILVLDGAMGTMIQQYRLQEQDYRGERFAAHPVDLKNNNEALCLVRPDII